VVVEVSLHAFITSADSIPRRFTWLSQNSFCKLHGRKKLPTRTGNPVDCPGMAKPYSDCAISNFKCKVYRKYKVNEHKQVVENTFSNICSIMETCIYTKLILRRVTHTHTHTHRAEQWPQLLIAVD
jgi:hypothetical protein